MRWIRDKISGHNPDRKFEEALHAVEELGSLSRDLQDKLEPYREEKDPFIAMWKDAYQNRQLANLYKGPRR
jgi:hypothetical protein